MQSLSTAYTVYYNLRYGRHGHLLDGRYKAKLVERAAQRLDQLRKSMGKPQKTKV
jgi:hypothetical protein